MKELYQQVLFYLGALWRRRWLVFGTACIMVAIGWAGVASLPDQYTSSARIYVDTGNVLRPLLAGVAVEDDINRQVDIMRQTLLSRPNMAELARMTDLDLTVNSPTQMEALIERLQERIELNSEQGENLFSISFTDRSPQVARDVVQALTTLFVENNLGQNREDIDNAQDFLNRQISEYERKLDTAERDLARFQQENAEFLPGQSGLQKNLADARAALKELRGALRDAEARQALLEEELANTSQMLGQGNFGSGPPSDIDVRIVNIQASLEELRSRYTDEHPDVVTLRRRLENLQAEKDAQLQAFGAQPAQQSTGGAIPNPVYSDLRLELVKERSNSEILKERVQRAQETVSSLEQKIFLVPEVDARLKRLTRDYNVIRENYEILLSRRESARISADREQQGDRVNFRIIEAASLPLSPTGPNRPLLMALALFASVGAGVGVAWLMAVTRVTYGSIDHLRRDFSLPVLGSLTSVGDHSAGQIRRVQTLKLMGAIAAVFAVFAGLLFLESRYGLQEMREIAFALDGCLLLIGALTLIFDKFKLGPFGQARQLTAFDRPGATA